MLKFCSLEKTLMLRKIDGKRRRGQQRMRQLESLRMRWLEGSTDSMDMNLSQLWQIVKDKEAWHAEVHGVTKNQTPNAVLPMAWPFSFFKSHFTICLWRPFLLTFPDYLLYVEGLSGWLNAKESACQFGRHWRWGLIPWLGRVPGGRKWKPIPLFLSGKS